MALAEKTTEWPMTRMQTHSPDRTGVLACTLLNTAHGDLPLFLSLCLCVCDALIKHAHWVDEFSCHLSTQASCRHKVPVQKQAFRLYMWGRDYVHVRFSRHNSERRPVLIFLSLTDLLPSLRLSNDEAITRTISSWKTVKSETNLVIFKGFTVLMNVIIIVILKNKVVVSC